MQGNPFNIYAEGMKSLLAGIMDFIPKTQWQDLKRIDDKNRRFIRCKILEPTCRDLTPKFHRRVTVNKISMTKIHRFIRL